MHPQTIGSTPAYHPRARVARIAAWALAVPLLFVCLGSSCPFLDDPSSDSAPTPDPIPIENCPKSRVLLGTQVILRVDGVVDTVDVFNATASAPRELADGSLEITITPRRVGVVSVELTERGEFIGAPVVAQGTCSFNVVAVGADDDGSGVADPCDAAPIVQPLTAEFNPAGQSTTYTVSADDADVDDLTYDWAMPSCGTVSFLFDDPDDGVPTDFTEMTWHHPHPPCDPTTDHASETITLVVSDGCWQVTCTYQGAESGHGPSCALPQRVSP